MKKQITVVVFILTAKIFSAQCYSVTQIVYEDDTSTTCTNLVMSDDQFSGVIQLPFSFCFFGNVYDRCVIGSNAVLSFDTAYANGYCQWPINAAIPTSSVPMNSIFFPWMDLYLSAGGNMCYRTIGTAPNRTFVVTVDSVPYYSCTGVFLTSRLELHETTNIIDIYVKDKQICAWNGSYSIEGLNNQTGTQAAVVTGRNYPSVWTSTGDAYRFTPNCCPAGIADHHAKESFSIYPNPSNGELHFISQNNPRKEFYLTVSDVSGRVVYRDELSDRTDRQLKIDAAAGVYFLQVRGANGEVVASEKIMLE